MVMFSLKNYYIYLFKVLYTKEFIKEQRLLPMRVQQMSKPYWIGPRFGINVLKLASCVYDM